jgi:hypothetical protein
MVLRPGSPSVVTSAFLAALRAAIERAGSPTTA